MAIYMLRTVQEAVHDLSTDIGQPVHDVGQSEQVDLKNRVVKLENALSIERAHRTAAEQVAAAERHRAQTAEMALRMLEQGSSALTSASSVLVDTSPNEPKLSWWKLFWKS